MLVYIFVLFGSFAGICILFGVRLLLRQQSIRRFVRNMKQRLRNVQERETSLNEEIQRQSQAKKKTKATPSADLQKLRSLARSVDKALARQNEEEAERLFIQALTIQPDAHDIRVQLAKFYLDTQRESKAIALYQELLTFREDTLFFANIGLAYSRLGQYEKSYEFYCEAYDRDQKDMNTAVALAQVCKTLFRYEEAAALLEKSCVVRSRDVDLLRLLAECYLQLCDRTKAQDVYKRINRLIPYDEEVKEKLLTLARA
jgi:tetratricopeptide (TPR) repeat protein